MKKLLFILFLLPLLSFAQVEQVGILNNALVVEDDSTVTVNGTLKIAEATHLFAFFGDSTVTFTYAAANTWYHITNAYDSLYRYQEQDGFAISNDTITITEAGDYDLCAVMNFEGGNAKTYAFRFYNTTSGQGIPVSGGVMAEGAADVIQVVTSAYLRGASAGDKIVFQTKQDDTAAALFRSSLIKIFKVHD